MACLGAGEGFGSALARHRDSRALSRGTFAAEADAAAVAGAEGARFQVVGSAADAWDLEAAHTVVVVHLVEVDSAAPDVAVVVAQEETWEVEGTIGRLAEA